MKTIKVELDYSDDIKGSLTADEPDEPEPYGKMVSTGCTLLNMALSDRPDGGWMEGKYYWLVGDSQSGKTFFALTCYAEAQLNDHFKKHRLIFDNVEDGALMDIERFFGPQVAKKIEPPREHKNKPVFSETIEDFYYHVDDALNDGRPFIYVLDSMDALTSKDEQKKFQEHKKHARKKEDGEGGKKDPAGSYGDGKAKKNSSGIRQITSRLSKTPSILIVISQTRDNIDAAPWGETKTVSGGRALRFYATCLVMTTITGQITQEVNGRTRKIGHYVGCVTKKNRITGKVQSIQTAIYPSYGIDDVGSAIDWLVFEKWWKKEHGVIKAKELDLKVKRKELIHMVETSEKYQGRLKKALRACWKRIEAESALDRPARYA